MQGELFPIGNQSTAIYKNRIADKQELESRYGLPEFPEGRAHFYTHKGFLFASEYNRVVYGDHGPYIEFLHAHISCSLKRKYNKALAEDAYYEWLEPYDGSGVKVYSQKRDVKHLKNPPKGGYNGNRAEGYADYKPGLLYVSPYELIPVLASNLKKYTFFWGKDDVFSNWHPSVFSYKGIQFSCVEQFMMYCKARLFHDKDTANKILSTDDPKTHKKLGRQVRDFNDLLWREKCQGYVYTGSREKYTQNLSMLDALLSTSGTTLVEASPYDRIWGIGMNKNDPRASIPELWKGRNLLGNILTNLRESLSDL